MKYLFPAILIAFSSSFLFAQKTDKAIVSILKKNKKLAPVLSKTGDYQVQILYTSIKDGRPSKTLSYNLSDKNYFYPASTVKLPAVLLALEKVNKIENVNRDTPMRVISNLENYPSIFYDSTAQSLLPSIGHYAKKILLVSDNDAFNRLYDFIGPKEFNEAMVKKGFMNFRAAHRLSIPLSKEVNNSKPQVVFGEISAIPAVPSFASTDRMEVGKAEAIYSEPGYIKESPVFKSNKSIPIGKAYMSDGKLVREPMDFSAKNVFTLTEQHDLLKGLFFPQTTSPNKRFDLTNDQLDFVKKYMSMLPRESDFPKYEEGDYYDSYVKFFMYGDQKARIPSNIKIYNKVGQAYGFLIDNAYISDTKNNISFILSAVIYTNEDGILNDDKYDYDAVGFPFLAELGRTIYNYELKKKK